MTAARLIRDMIYHAGTEGDPRMRVAKARWVLGNFAKSSPSGTPYGEMLRSEAKLLARFDGFENSGGFSSGEHALLLPRLCCQG